MMQLCRIVRDLRIPIYCNKYINKINTCMKCLSGGIAVFKHSENICLQKKEISKTAQASL